jgi:hypothetical protein
MAMATITTMPFQTTTTTRHSYLTNFLFSSSNLKRFFIKPSRFFHHQSKRFISTPRLAVKACAIKVEEKNVAGKSQEWEKVSAVLFDMDGVLCNSEEPSRRAAVDVFAEIGVQVTVDDFVPFTGTGTLHNSYLALVSQLRNYY